MSDVNKELDKLEKQQEIRGQAHWYKFTEVGQAIQGTLLTRFRAVSQLNQDQIVYVIKNDEGIFNVAFNAKYDAIHRELVNAVVGQIVRFVFQSEQPHKTKGFNPIKIIRVFTRPDLLDDSAKTWASEYGFTFGEEIPAAGELTDDEAEAEEETPTSSRPLGGGIPRT